MNPLLLARFAPWGLAAILALVAGIQTVRVSDLKTDAAELATAHAQSIAKHEQAARARERQHVEAMAAIDTQHQQERDRAKTAIAKLSADLAAGTQRLRQRFTCPAVKPSASASPGPSDENSGLLPADVGILIGLASECDGHVRSLQAVIQSDRGQ